MIGKVLLLTAAAGVAVVIAVSLPDILRYKRMREM
ncbi:DUF6893 family small protein [Streptosporangium sp. NPDC001559]|uniref:DUF6893 family small protein n=1 Tax=Streptosporangium jomthongense TaxID=1193683 RepID=A0ABV8FER4_9ACTN